MSNPTQRLRIERAILLPALLWGLVLGVLLVSTQPGLASSEDPRVSIQRLKVKDQQVILTFQLHNAFDQDLQRRIDSGLPAGFVFNFQLVRDFRWWFNSSVDSATLQVEAMYNAVTREYLINYRHDGHLVESRLVREVEELREAMTRFSELALFSIDGSASQQRLQVRARAELGSRTIFFFIPRLRTTDWVVTRRFEIASEGE